MRAGEKEKALLAPVSSSFRLILFWGCFFLTDTASHNNYSTHIPSTDDAFSLMNLFLSSFFLQNPNQRIGSTAMTPPPPDRA